MEGRQGLSRQSTALWRSFRNGDFEEQDVWDVLNERRASKVSDSTLSDSIIESVSAANHFPSASRMIPRPNGSNIQTPHQRSAPRSIPQWFRTAKGKKNPRQAWNDDGGGDNEGRDDDGVADDVADSDDDDDDEEEFGDKVPPHELIAKRLARSQISSFSVFEGVGRTLKGRDLSKVRNAVLTKTGFLESL